MNLPIRAKILPVAWLLPLLLFAAGMPRCLHAQTTETFNYDPNLAIPDGSSVGVADVRTVASAITQITSIWVTLQVTGSPTAYNGDFYAYLTHGATGFCVLWNRTGRTASNTFGYADNGFNVTFDGSAANGNIHNYRPVSNPNGGVLTGLWQPDARNVDPADALDTTPSTATLSSFTGLNANGGWTLFIADVSSVDTGTLAGWGLEITGVPEPSTICLSVAGGLLPLGAWARKRWSFLTFAVATALRRRVLRLARRRSAVATAAQLH